MTPTPTSGEHKHGIAWRYLLASVMLASIAIGRDAHAASVAINPVVRSLEGDVTIDVGTRALGSFSIDVTYNPSVFTIEAVLPGTTAGFTGTVLTNPASFTTGTTRIAGFNSGTSPAVPTGVVNIAQVQFKPVGASGATSPIGATVVSLTDTTNAPISVSTPQGFNASLSSRCLLDIDSNNTVLAGRDILFIARTVLRLSPVPASVRLANPTLPSDTAIREMVRGRMCPTLP